MNKTPTTFVVDPAPLKIKLGMQHGRGYKLRVAQLKDQTIYHDGKVVAKVSGLFPVGIEEGARVSINGCLKETWTTTVLLLLDTGMLYAASSEGINLSVLPSVEDLWEASILKEGRQD